MRFACWLAALFVFFFSWNQSVSAYYVSDNFSSPNNWIPNLKYNMALGVWTNLYQLTGGDQGPELTNFTTAGNQLLLTNGYAAGPVGYTTSLYGIYALFTNGNLNASKENPVGFEITRSFLRNDNGSASWLAGVFNIGFVEAKASVTNGATINGMEGQKFDQTAIISELDWQDKSPTSYFGWQEALFTNSKIILTGPSNEAGLVNSLQNILEWDHNAATNTNAITFRFVNDGENIYWYANPNPRGNNAAYSNTYYLLSKTSVVFSNNLRPFLGIATLNYNGFSGCLSAGTSRLQLGLSNFIVRSVCSNVVSEISPAELKAGATSALYFGIKPNFSTNEEAGVGEFYVDLPSGYSWTNAGLTNAMSVHFISSTGTLAKTFGRTYGIDANPSAGNVNVTLKNVSSGDRRRLKIRFNSGETFHPDNGGGTAATNAILLIVSNFTTLQTADAVGKAFEIYVNNEKYPDSAWTKAATTGKMKSFAGNAVDMPLIASGLRNYDVLALKTYNGPSGHSSISPNKVYEGDLGILYYNVSALFATNNNADVSKVFIIVTNAFSIDTNYLYSEKMGISNTPGIFYLSNANGSNIIVLNYESNNTYLPAGSGVDTITIRFTNTPAVPDNNPGLTNYWPAVFYSSLTGDYTNTGTNSFYPSQMVLTRKKPPSGLVSISPLTVSNTLVSNNFTIVVQNTAAGTDNKIKLVRIKLPELFTNAANISSDLLGTPSAFTSNGSIYLIVDYTNGSATNFIVNNGYDNIHLTLQDNVAAQSDLTNVSVSNVEADNMNGDGWTSLSEDPVNGWDMAFFTPPARALGYVDSPNQETNVSDRTFHHIYTDVDITNIVLVIKNDSEEGNEITNARILFPSGITNAQLLGDNKLAMSVVSNERTNIGGGITNTNAVLYLQYTNTLKPKTGATIAEQDSVSLRIWNVINTPSMAQIEISTKNCKTNYTRAVEIPYDARLSYIYPPVNADGFLVMPDGFVDSSTNDYYELRYEVANRGNARNVILKSDIFIPTNFITNVKDYSSALITNNTSSYLSYDKNTGIFSLNYAQAFIDGNALAFSGGTNDTVVFYAIDIVSNNQTIVITNMISNNRQSAVLSVSNGKSQSLVIQNPPVMASYKIEPSVLFTETNMKTNTIVFSITNRGRGSNKLDYLKIDVPTALQGKILDIYDLWMNLSNSQDAAKIFISGPQDTIYINYYLSSVLPSGSNDTLSIYFRNNFTNETNCLWNLKADNFRLESPPETNLDILPAYSNVIHFVDRAEASVSPNGILTSSDTNAFAYVINNGKIGDSRGVQIFGVLIDILSPFTNAANLSCGNNGTAVFTNINGTNRVFANYPLGLNPGEADTIRFTLDDNWAVGTNTAILRSSVDYGDGGGFRSALIQSNKSITVDFSFPPAAATAYVTRGEMVPEDFTNYTYEFYLKNTTIFSGNNIKLVKITPPSTITNISFITSVVKGVSGVYDGTNVWVNYAASSMDLQISETDTIRLIGYDNVTNGDVYSNWGFKIANATNGEFTTNEQYLIAVNVPNGTTLSNIIYKPNCKAAAYIEAIGGVSGYENRIWTTITSNTFKYTVYNQSDSGNNLTKTRIYIPGVPGLFDTNSLQIVTNLMPAAISVSNKAITIVYNTPLVPGSGDVLTFRINDNLSYGETNLNWTNDSAYDTSDNRFKAAIPYGGHSWTLFFDMPSPSALAGIVYPNPAEVYTKTTNYTIAYSISNTGSGTADLWAAFITIPAPYRAGFSTGNASNSFATNIIYNSSNGVLALYYSNNFKPASNDLVYLSFANGTLSETNFNMDCFISNSTYSASAGDIDLDAKKLRIVSVPTYYLSPSSLSTVTYSNAVNVYINNDITGSGGLSKLSKVVVSFSTPFTNKLSVQSLLINSTNIKGMISSITLDYQAEGKFINAGGNDNLSISLLDQIDMGGTNTLVSMRGYNGYAWVDFDPALGYSNIIDFVMPSPVATAQLSCNQLYTTVSATNIGIKVVNKGTGSNKLTKVRLTLPAGFANLTVLSNQYFPDALSSVSSNVILVDYQTTNLFNSGFTDVLWCAFSNTYEAATNLNVLVEGANLTNGNTESNLVVFAGEGGESALNIYMNFPAISVFGYINGRSEIYTINTNDKVEYRIVNNSVNTTLTKAKIYYDSNLILSSVSNTWIASVVSISNSEPNNSNYLLVDYSANPIPFDRMDKITLNILYSITNITNFLMDSQVYLTQATNGWFATASAGYTKLLRVTQGNWGKVAGNISPQGYQVNVKIYYPGSSTLATNVDGELVSTLSETNGQYNFSLIPAGGYSLELTSSKFRTYRASITVISNTTNMISTITLQNAPLSPEATSVQQVVSYDDNKTKIEFPTSSVKKDFSVDIRLFDLTADQKDDLNKNKAVLSPSSVSGLKGYRLSIYDLNNNPVEGEVLNLDATLYLSYSKGDIESRGWSEDNLAVYYWDRVLKKWIKIGGKADTVNQWAIAKASYVHDQYAVFGGKTEEGVIKNVAVRPRVFTPTKDESGYFGNVRITFELDAAQTASGYQVKIYDLRGGLIRSFKRDGANTQGEIAWDAKDESGYPVKSGIYIYRVIAGNSSYSGTVIIVR
jgi:hypothetical protein